MPITGTSVTSFSRASHTSSTLDQELHCLSCSLMVR